MITPITTQIKEIQTNVTQIAQTADAAMELGLASQDTRRQLQKNSEWAMDKIIMLENQLKQFNIKTRGFPEGAEESTELRIFISTWLASHMDLEDGVAPLLDVVYRLGPPRRASNALPRDILVKCTDLCTKNKILPLSRSKGSLQYSTHKITILQDLSAETLEYRRRLKPLTTILMREKNTLQMVYIHKTTCHL